MSGFTNGQERSVVAIRDAINENDTIRDLYRTNRVFHEMIEAYCANPTCNSPLAVARHFTKQGGAFKLLAKAISDQWMDRMSDTMQAIRNNDNGHSTV